MRRVLAAATQQKRTTPLPACDFYPKNVAFICRSDHLNQINSVAVADICAPPASGHNINDEDKQTGVLRHHWSATIVEDELARPTYLPTPSLE